MKYLTFKHLQLLMSIAIFPPVLCVSVVAVGYMIFHSFFGLHAQNDRQSSSFSSCFGCIDPVGFATCFISFELSMFLLCCECKYMYFLCIPYTGKKVFIFFFKADSYIIAFNLYPVRKECETPICI